MFENPALIKASISLGTLAAKNSTQAIFDKIKTSKVKNSSEETIASLEEIINNLIAEKNELISIAQFYDAQLVSQKISEVDIQYITTNLLPLLEKMLEESDQKNNIQNLEIFKPLLSKETFNILQLLGFNFKKALGEPLTELINGLISSQIRDNSDKTIEYQILNAQREIEYFKMLQDEDAYQRFLELSK